MYGWYYIFFTNVNEIYPNSFNYCSWGNKENHWFERGGKETFKPIVQYITYPGRAICEGATILKKGLNLQRSEAVYLE